MLCLECTHAPYTVEPLYLCLLLLELGLSLSICVCEKMCVQREKEMKSIVRIARVRCFTSSCWKYHCVNNRRVNVILKGWFIQKKNSHLLTLVFQYQIEMIWQNVVWCSIKGTKLCGFRTMRGRINDEESFGWAILFILFFIHCQELCVLNMYTTRWESTENSWW